MKRAMAAITDVDYCETNKEIGRLLFISHRTVEKHRAKAITKLNIESKTGALFKWVQKNKHLFQ